MLLLLIAAPALTFSSFDNLSMPVGCQSLLLQLALLSAEGLLRHLAWPLP